MPYHHESDQYPTYDDEWNADEKVDDVADGADDVADGADDVADGADDVADGADDVGRLTS